MKIEKITIANKNGYKISGIVYKPETSVNCPVIIFAHGFNSNYRMFTHHAEGFAKQGIICVLFDFCGGSLETLSDLEMNQMTVLTEADDYRAVIDYVLTLPEIDKDRIYIHGESMGGFVASYVAHEYQDKVAGAILWYPAFCIPSDSKKRYEVGDNTALGVPISPMFNEASMNIDIYEKLGQFRKKILIIHGDKDNVVDLSYSKKALDLYDNIELIVIPGAGHGFDGEDSMLARSYTAELIIENAEI